MAFVTSSPIVTPRWGRIHQQGVTAISKKGPCVIIRSSTSPHMVLGDLGKTAAEFAAVAGVVTLAAVTINAQSADAAIFHFSGPRPSNLGVQYGRYLQACPPSPNCVSSSANVVSTRSFSWRYLARIMLVPALVQTWTRCWPILTTIYHRWSLLTAIDHAIYCMV